MNPAIKNARPLSTGQTILFAVSAIVIFVLTAIICGLLTSWITPVVLKVVTREFFLRMPLTIYLLHVFARRVVKNYDLSVMYGRPVLRKIARWGVIGLVLPVIIWSGYYLSHLIVPFPQSQPISVPDQLSLIVKWVAVSIAAGITEEILFRGHLLMIICNKCTKFKAMLITSLIFGLVHIAMLTSFHLQDIFIVTFGGFLAGMMFSAIYFRTGVIWYAAVIHILWDIFFIGKITAISFSQADANNTVSAFKLTTQNLLFTGGTFGMEASLPCLMLYLAVTAAAFYCFKPANCLSAGS